MQPRVDMQRATAALRSGQNHFTAIALQNSNRSFVQTRECNICNTPGEESNPVSTFTNSRKGFSHFGKEKGRFCIGRKRLDLRKLSERFQYAGRTYQPLQSQCL